MKRQFGHQQLINHAFRLPQDVVLWDIFPISDKESVSIIFESKQSALAQGVWLMTDRGIEIENQRGSSIVLWYETAPSRVNIRCYTSNGLLNLYNVWDEGRGMNSQAYTSGMLIEELPNGRRYKCNDFGFDTKFDKLIFRIERESRNNR